MYQYDVIVLLSEEPLGLTFPSTHEPCENLRSETPFELRTPPKFVVAIPDWLACAIFYWVLRTGTVPNLYSPHVMKRVLVYLLHQSRSTLYCARSTVYTMYPYIRIISGFHP
jgi:hypothetical protein